MPGQRTTHDFDPSRKVLSTADPRLNRILLHEAERCSSLNEYAAATGIDTADLVELLSAALDDGTIALELLGGTVFVLTAPLGRPLPPGACEVAPNLWELLRRRLPLERAEQMWRLIRALELAGWVVEIHQSRIMFGMGPVQHQPYIGIGVGQSVVPVLEFPSEEALTSPTGSLAEYDRAGAASVAVVCAEGALDTMTTAVRRWFLAHDRLRPKMSVLILEAPRFNPTLLSPADAAVAARAVHRSLLPTPASWAERRNKSAR